MRTLLPALLPTVLLGACVRPGVPDHATHHTLATAERLAVEGDARWPGADLAFDWIPTVWTFGLHRLHAATGDATYQEPYRDWVAAHAAHLDEGAAPFHSSDSMSPALVAAALKNEDPSAEVGAVLQAADAYLAQAPTTDEGAIEHWTEDSPFGVPDQVWVDSQFMFGLYLLEQHERTGDRAHLDTFVEQYELFSQLCRDEGSDLYRHAYDDVTDANIPEGETYWARGNSWVLISAAEMLTRTGLDDPAAEVVLPLFRSHAAAVAATQSDDGLWHTVLNQPQGDDPANYTETSASALIAYAFVKGLRSGALDDEPFLETVALASRGLHARIDEDDGELVVEGTSYGTNPGDYAYYVSIGTADNLMLGNGSLVMFLAEVHGLQDPLEEPGE